MNQKSSYSIFYFILGAFLCLSPSLSFFWVQGFGISQRISSELIPSLAKVDQVKGLQLEMPIFLIRQQIVPYFTEINPIFTFIFFVFALIGILALSWEIKIWSKISTRQFYLGIGIWVLIFAIKLFPFEKNLIISSIGNFTLVTCLLSLVTLSILSSQTIPHLILQFGRKKAFSKTKRNYTLLYLVFLIDLGFGLYQQSFGNSLRPELMITILCLQWAVFWFQISSDSNLQGYKYLFAGIYLLSIPAVYWFYIHQNDAAIRFAFEWNFKCTFIMAILFPMFVFSNFKEIFSKNLALHTVVFKAHRIPLYLYQIGVLIVGLTWTFARNASLFHVFLAGYYNQIGDLEILSNKPQLAKISYQMAQGNSRLNLKSNFELARLSTSDEEKAQYLTYTLSKKPHLLTYLSVGTIYAKNDHPFQALFTYQEGFEKFPESAELATALAIQFEKLNQPKDALKYFQMASDLAPENASLFSNKLYAQAQFEIGNRTISAGFEEDLGTQTNRIALYLLQQKTVPFEFKKDFQMEHNVQNFAYLYNAEMYLKDKMPAVDYTSILNNDGIASTFPELKTLEAWHNYYQQKPLIGLDQLSLIIAQDTTAKTQGLQNILGFWKDAQLKSNTNLNFTDLRSAKKALESHPFNLQVLQKAIPILNVHKQQNLGYQYAMAALRYNENIATYYPIYAHQALEISEITYAKDAMAKLKQLDLGLYEKEIKRFEKKVEKVKEISRF